VRFEAAGRLSGRLFVAPPSSLGPCVRTAARAVQFCTQPHLSVRLCTAVSCTRAICGRRIFSLGLLSGRPFALRSSCSLPPHTRTSAHPHTYPPQNFLRTRHSPPRSRRSCFIWALCSFYSHSGRRAWTGPVVRGASRTSPPAASCASPPRPPPSASPPARSSPPCLAPCRTCKPAPHGAGTRARARCHGSPGGRTNPCVDVPLPGRAWLPVLLSVRTVPSRPR